MRKWPCRAAPSRWVQRTLHQIVQCQEWNDQAYTKNSDIWWDMSITTDHSRITFVLPYICLPRCIRIGVVESIHVPTLGRQFSCGIQTITQGAPEITCITRWRTDQYIHNRSKGDIKWDKTAGCINFHQFSMQFLNMISVASFIILLPRPQRWDADLDGFPSCRGSVHCDLPVPTGLPHGRLPGPNRNQWNIRGRLETSCEPTIYR